ncbi:helix-turn-helix domain-containing protein [Actinocrinis sp.]|uniref:helix-turn-helix domain-containing protein n=1 Tax=Actinocrinis sp. TaxID=1920516 RepID=UPI0039C86E5D
MPVSSVAQLAASGDGGPTVLRILLGAQLRRLRTAAGISREAAGQAIRGSHAKISRIELGQVSLKQRDIADLLTLYGVRGATERDAFFALMAQANSHGWWHSFADLVPDWFEVYVGLEEAASVIRSYEVQFVPGLLQTEDYARAVIRLGHGLATPEEIERRVGLRMGRARLLHREQPPTLWAVIDEAALRRPLGGPAVMRAQLEHLLEASKLPNVSIQVATFSRGGHAAAGGPFSILRFTEPTLPDIVYLEQLTSATYLDKRADLDNYSMVINQLCVGALPAADTTDFLIDVIKDMDAR